MNRIHSFGSSTFASLKIRNFRLYFLGQAISLTGTWMQTVGQAWLVLQLTGSGTMLGLVTAIQFLPILIFGPWGGVITDRFPKRKLLFLTQLLSGILALVLAILVVTHTVTLWMVFALAFGLGLVNALDNPIRQTFVIEMVGKDLLPNAVTLNSTEINLARVVGPAIAGIVIVQIGLAACFFMNAISYIAVLVVLLRMDKTKLMTTSTVGKAKGQLMEGFRYVASNQLLRNTLIMMLVIGTLTYEFTISLPLVANFVFRNGATGFTVLTSALGLGSVIGSLLTASRKHSSPNMLVYIAFGFGASTLLASAVTSYLAVTLAIVLTGMFAVNFNIIGNVILQMESDPQMRGRVMSLWTVAFLGSTPIGGPIIGWVGEHIGPRASLAVGGYAAIAAAVFGYIMVKRGKLHSIKYSAQTESIDALEDKGSRPL